ncbi:MAG: hypothetical protein R3C44_24365 [Chloroflexota bacterium]
MNHKPTFPLLLLTLLLTLAACTDVIPADPAEVVTIPPQPTQVVSTEPAATLPPEPTATPVAEPTAPPTADFRLTILHNNDGESQVINAGPELEDFGGAAVFTTVVNTLRDSADTDGVVMISSGDNFLAGPEFAISLENGAPYYDTIVMEQIGYDAVNLGNHDFDFGPDVLAQFLDGYTDAPPYVSANLDFSDEPALQAYVDAGVIRPSVVVDAGSVPVGIIGLETPNLPFNSSPRDVGVGQDLVTPVMTAVEQMTEDGVTIIILTSHLQDIRNEVDLVAQLEGYGCGHCRGRRRAAGRWAGYTAAGRFAGRPLPTVGQRQHRPARTHRDHFRGVSLCRPSDYPL